MLKKLCELLILVALAVYLLTPVAARAVTAPPLAVPPGFSLAEIKMTGSEFVLIMNNTGATISDLSQYWLQSFNNVNPGAPGVTSSIQQLPTGSLLAGQTILLSEGGSTCGAAITDSLTVSLADGSGYMQIIQNSVVGGVLSQTVGDALSWSSATNSTPGMISSVPSNSSDPLNAWYRYQNSVPTPAYLWQKAKIESTTNICQLNVVDITGTAPVPTSTGNLLLPGLPPPATIVSIMVEADANTKSGQAASNIGLRAPVLNELLPNPKEPQTDAEDEFVELYNSNDAVFDLSGFKLQAKSSTSDTKRTYTFPSGTKIAPKGFAAYPSENISISLANKGGQVWLLDPDDNVISQTDPFGEAKDGLAWALADGKWYWTTTSTAGSANVISGSISSGSSSSASGVGVVEGAKAGGTLGSAPASGSSGTNNTDKNALLHPAIIAAVAAAALIYGLHEYRGDIANKYHQYKSNRATRRETRKKP